MNVPACLTALPEGYRLIQGGRGVLVVRDGYSASLVDAGFGPDDGDDLPASDVVGRRPLGALEVQGEALLVRFHQHGGLLRFLTGNRFLDAGRPCKELALSERLRALGIATPVVVAVRVQRVWGLFWRLALVSRRVRAAVDLEQALGACTDAKSARHLIVGMGQLVGRLHRVGLLHSDLHPGNMLVEQEAAQAHQPALWILDLDRCQLLNQPLTNEQRWGMLARLARYFRRRPHLAKQSLGATNLMRFMRAYQKELREKNTEDTCKQDWNAVAGRLESQAKRHRLGWFFEELVGAGLKPRRQRRVGDLS